MEYLNHWVLQTVAMLATALLIPKLRIKSLFGAFKIVVLLALLNAFVWDAALFFSIPDAMTSQAITLFLVNGLIFWGLVKVLDGIEVEGFLPALVAPIVFTVFNLIIAEYAPLIDWTELFDVGRGAIETLKDDLGTPGEAGP